MLLFVFRISKTPLVHTMGEALSDILQQLHYVDQAQLVSDLIALHAAEESFVPTVEEFSRDSDGRGRRPLLKLSGSAAHQSSRMLGAAARSSHIFAGAAGKGLPQVNSPKRTRESCTQRM